MAQHFIRAIRFFVTCNAAGKCGIAVVFYNRFIATQVLCQP